MGIRWLLVFGNADEDSEAKELDGRLPDDATVIRVDGRVGSFVKVVVASKEFEALPGIPKFETK